MQSRENTSWNKVAKWYQNVPKEATGFHQELIIPGLKKLLKRHLQPGVAIMDFACGEGTVTKVLHDAGYVMSGFDLANDLINYAKDLYKGINFSKQNATSFSVDFAKNNFEKYSGVVSILALQNIADLDKAFANVASLLVNEGIFIFVLNHPSYRIPKASSWGYNGSHKQFRIVEKYMSEQKIAIDMHPGRHDSEITYSFHRPLQTFAKSLLKNNLAIIDVEEWVSTKKSEPGPRAQAENNARKEIPLFMTIVAKKLNKNASI